MTDSKSTLIEGFNRRRGKNSRNWEPDGREQEGKTSEWGRILGESGGENWGPESKLGGLHFSAKNLLSDWTKRLRCNPLSVGSLC